MKRGTQAGWRARRSSRPEVLRRAVAAPHAPDAEQASEHGINNDAGYELPDGVEREGAESEHHRADSSQRAPKQGQPHAQKAGLCGRRRVLRAAAVLIIVADVTDGV